jgi:MerR family transcriptional regulator, thiopeptide resistance regulator
MSDRGGIATFSVGEVASLAGVSVRALHHYDETGLLVPSYRTRAGYRRYTRGDLDRLQELLVYRRLGFTLKQVAGLIDDPTHDRRTALLHQRDLLGRRIDELATVRRLVERTLTSMEGATAMSDEERFEGLGTYERNEAEFGAEVRERWAETEAYTESARRTSSYGEGEWAAIKAASESIEADFADLLAAGVPSDDVAAMDVAERHRRQIDARFYPCSHEMHVSLGEMYTADPRFTEHYEQRRAGLAAYVQDAILANALRAG